MAKYYKVDPKAFSFDEVNPFPDCTEEERGLNDQCEEGGEHEWLIYPSHLKWVKEGGKGYLHCLKCGKPYHF